MSHYAQKIYDRDKEAKKLSAEYIVRKGQDAYLRLLGHYKSIGCERPTKYSHLNQWQKVKFIERMKDDLDVQNIMGELTNQQRNAKNLRMVMNSENTKVERIWVTATGRELPVSKMEDNHLHNTILFIFRALHEGQLVIGRNREILDFYHIMEKERINRGMPLPLVPYKSLKFRRKGN